MTHLEPFTPDQIAELDKPLPTPLTSTRKGSNRVLSYIEGHDAIDQANRIFGYGNWAYRTLECSQTVLIDPSTGEAVGVAYKAKVELTVRGGHAAIVEVGSQPVASWNVTDVVMSRRKEGDDRPIQEWEKVTARRTIVEAHEHAEKGSVTDAMKRALRTFGAQFGNGLYGDGTAVISQAPTNDIKTIQLAAKSVGIATNKEQWAMLKVKTLGTDIPNANLQAVHLAELRRAIEQAA